MILRCGYSFRNLQRRNGRVVALILAGALAVYSVYERQFLKIGDINEGAPELRPDSAYNKDIKFAAR